MISFYQSYRSVQSLTGQLTWTHYCELLSISDKDKRSFYEKECINAKWSVRELRRQIQSSLFERLLLSNGNANKKKVLKLALKGNEITKPEDIVKDPYVFEFLGLPENKPIMESDIERECGFGICIRWIIKSNICLKIHFIFAKQRRTD